MRCLHHPNLMRLEEVFESDNSLYIVFELLEGGQL
jgi:serine/threonine protein kinase